MVSCLVQAFDCPLLLAPAPANSPTPCPLALRPGGGEPTLLSPRQRWRSSTSSTSTLIFPSHHPLHVSHITAMPEKNVCRYLNKVDSRGRACVTITRYTCILDVTLDPPNAWIIIQTMRSTFIRLVIQLAGRQRIAQHRSRRAAAALFARGC